MNFILKFVKLLYQKEPYQPPESNYLSTASDEVSTENYVVVEIEIEWK